MRILPAATLTPCTRLRHLPNYRQAGPIRRHFSWRTAHQTLPESFIYGGLLLFRVWPLACSVMHAAYHRLPRADVSASQVLWLGRVHGRKPEIRDSKRLFELRPQANL